jgi:hypothetical protein
VSDSASENAFEVALTFTSDLCFFLPRAGRAGVLTRRLREKTSIKDVIESCGVPHTEVDLIKCNGGAVPFEHHVSSDANVRVEGVLHRESERTPGLQTRSIAKFVADGHLGKLARDLRLLGFDVAYDSTAVGHALAEISSSQDRALLTRDRRLLMHRTVRDGYCLRSTDPAEQTVEVLRRYRLAEALAPYTRCIQCNGLLARVDKSEVLEQLEPLTRLYYDDFRRCSGCGKVYWSGSHFAKLERRIEQLRERLNRKPEIEIRK